MELLEADSLRLVKKGKIQIGWASSRLRLHAMTIVSMSVKAQTEARRALDVAKMAIKGRSAGRKSPSASSARRQRISAPRKLPQLPGGSGCGEKQVLSEMIQVLQGNSNRAREAGTLLDQIAREEDSIVLLLSEQSFNMNHKYWLSDDAGYCTIWL